MQGINRMSAFLTITVTPKSNKYTAFRMYETRSCPPKIHHTDMAKKSKDGLRDIARAARQDRDARNTRFRVEHTQLKGQICNMAHRPGEL